MRYEATSRIVRVLTQRAFICLAAMLVGFSFTSPSFLTVENFSNIVNQIAPIQLAPPVNVSPDYERLAVADTVNVAPPGAGIRFLRVVFQAP